MPNHTLNGVPEWAYGVTDWLELGAYVPLYSWTGSGHFLIDGAKLRAEFVVPHAQERTFFYGVNFELSFNALYWEPTRNSGEIRPINRSPHRAGRPDHQSDSRYSASGP